MDMEDVPLELWLSVAATVLVVAWFLGEDAASERRHRQLVWLEKVLLWGTAMAVVAGLLGWLAVVVWEWMA